MKHLRVFILFIVVAAILVTSVAAVSVTTATETIGGKSATVVYITPDNDTYIEAVLANNSVSTDAYASDIISGAGKDLIAAVNGNFFMSYYNASQPIDVNAGNYPQIFGAIIKDGKMINSGGAAAIGIDYNGNIKIGRVNLVGVAKLGGTTFYAWGVNTIYNDATAVYILTEEFDYPVDIPDNFTIVELSNGKVSKMFSGRNDYVVANGTIAVVIGNGYGTKGVRIGDSAEYYFEDRNGDRSWSQMRNIIGGSGLIVENGMSAVDNNPNVTAADQNPDVSAQHSFVAQLADGRLMLGTVSSSYRAIATSLIQKGATNAMFLDGGASSMLYANGKQLTSAGRKLASILGVFDASAETSVQPAAPQSDSPSSWAAADVNEASQRGILPQSLAGKYQQSITRGEFCQLIAGYIYASTGESIDHFCASQGCSINYNRFSDTRDSNIACVASLGIVTGYPDGTFQPNASIKRQDAAIMLCRLAKAMGADASGTAKTFTDSAKISDYAKEGVDFVTGLGIMNGHASGAFAPLDTITREQAVITIMNTLRVL